MKGEIVMSITLPNNYYYTDEHIWLKVEDEVVRVGVTDHAQDELGDVVFAEISEVNEQAEAGETFGNVESVKTVSELYAPISGEIIEVNERLEDEPELINVSPYSEGWLIVIKPENLEEVSALMTAEQYFEFLKGVDEAYVNLNLAQINDVDLTKK